MSMSFGLLIFFLALVLKNYVYRRHSFNGGPSSPATSTTSTDDGEKEADSERN